MNLTFYKVTKEKMYKVRRHWLTIAFLLGFVIDNITLNRVDQVFDNIVLLSYVILAMVSLLVLYAATAGKLPERILARARTYAPLLVQFSFGGLLSGMLIFYGRSGTVIDSWPFILMILIVIYGNETIRDRAQRLVFNLAMLFVGLFSYIALVIPVLTGLMGPWIFVGCGVLSLMIMYWFIRLLRRIIPNFIQMQMRAVIFTIGLLFVSLNVLYFTNIIPPIPLSLKDVGIYHNVIKFDTGEYQLTYEKSDWWQLFRNSDDEFRYEPGDNIYCFASVFAPTRLATDIYHRWEYYDEKSKDWIEHGRFSYAIEGGRGSGFRGYTLVKNYQEGRWRCSVETERGQVIGRTSFEVVGGERKELVSRVE
jgi:hypothetical protein